MNKIVTECREARLAAAATDVEFMDTYQAMSVLGAEAQATIHSDVKTLHELIAAREDAKVVRACIALKAKLDAIQAEHVIARFVSIAYSIDEGEQHDTHTQDASK